MSGLHVTFLAHSGFAVETATKVLVFDYFKDPAGVVKAYAARNKKVWFFVTHWHEDHFNPAIADFAGPQTQYILNDGVHLQGVPAPQCHVMHVYDSLTLEDVQITQYGSTDEGGSFWVETDGCAIFHAGDLNWWHWLGDTDENNAEAKANIDREMKHLAGKTADLAFFPVDARLEGAREWGVMRFLQDVTVRRCLVPMHYFGAPWTPSAAFKQKYGNVPLWIPQQNGDETDID